MISIYKNPFAFVIFNGNTQTVGIGVRSHYNVSIGFDGFFHCHIQCSWFFGVWRNYSGEISAHHILLGHIDNIGKTIFFQRTWNKFHACTMNRSVHNFQVAVALNSFRRQRKCFDGFDKGFVNFLADNFNQFRTTFKLNVIHLDIHNFIDYICVVWSNHLSTIVPVSFVTVIFFRIVRSSKNNTTLTT